MIPVRVYNASGEAIPAYGIMRVTGAAMLDKQTVVTVDKPNVYGGRAGRYLVNEVYPIPAGQYGQAQRGPVVSLYYNGTDGTPAVGEEWGPVDTEWRARKNVPGFRIVGFPEADDYVVQAIVAPIVTLLVKTDAAHASGASGTVTIYSGAIGSETFGYGSVTAYNRFGDLESGDWARAVPVGDDDWDLLPAGAGGGDAPTVMIGKPDANIAKGASGTVSVWSGEPGSETDTGNNVTAYAKARAVTSGKFVTLTQMPGNTGVYVDCWEA